MFLITYFFILFIIPHFVGLTLGTHKGIEETDLSGFMDNFLIGFFLMLAIFEVLCVPMAALRMSLTSLTVIYSAILLLLSAWNLYRFRREIGSLSYKVKGNLSQKSLTGYIRTIMEDIISGKDRHYELIYMIPALAGFLWLIYKTIVMDFGFWSYDDATYVAKSMTSVYTDSIVIMGDTKASMALKVRRWLNSWEIFIAFLCRLTGLDAARMCHTVLNTTLLLFIFAVFYLIAVKLFEKSEERWLFLVLISVINIFGYHSVYSFAFRMLITLWQAKGVYMALIVPYTFYKFSCYIYTPVDKIKIYELLVLSLAACSLTSTGVGMECAIIMGMTVIATVFTKRKTDLKYLVGCFPCVFFLVMYIILRKNGF